MSIAIYRFLENPKSRANFENDIMKLCDHAKAVLITDEVSFIFSRDHTGIDFYVPPNFSSLSPENQTEFRRIGLELLQSDPVGASNTFLRTGERPDENEFVIDLIVNDESQALGVIVARRTVPRQSGHALTLRLISESVKMLVNLYQSQFELSGCLEREERSHQTIKDAEEQFSALSKNVPGAIFQYVRLHCGEERIQTLSPGSVELWGHTPEEMESNPELLWSAVLPEDLEGIRASIQRSQDNLFPWQHRWRVRHKLGFLKWLQAYGTPYRTIDDGVAWNTLILDVTVEQEAQIALAENTRLLHEAQKLESIGRLAGGVAHDFNNLLAVIVGNAEVIAESGVRADVNESLHEIIEASQRGATLVKQLLSFARKSDLRAIVANIREVLVAVESMLGRVLPANVSLEVVQRAGLWPVQIDRAMFESALLNIIINARDAMPEGGAITIETSNERVDDDYIIAREEDIRPGRYVMVAVTDTGAGIEDAALPFVFEPFYSTKNVGDGAGLGLAMVQGFVKQSRGAVRIYSEPGRGTSLKMYFPALDQDALVESDNGKALPTLGNVSATVLLVEDQEEVRRIIEKTIASAGYKVIVASSGDEAIELYKEKYEDIDILVTDVVMPGKIQGPQLVRLARKINHNLPALYMSGYPHEANVHGNGIRAGDISLLKPIRRTDLLTALEKLWRHQ